MNKSVLVTGSHRSGTTWTGSVIAKANNIRYIHEPFNIGIPRSNNPLTFWFEHLNKSSQDHQKTTLSYLKSFATVLHRHNISRISDIRSFKDIYKYLADLKSRKYDRTLYKDPIALLSAEWMYEKLDCNVVVLIRHPAAFVASLKKQDWQFDFYNFLQQEELMKSHFKEYSESIKKFTDNTQNIIDQAILLWNTIHSVIEYYKEKHGDTWYFVNHEKLSKNTSEEFKKLFDHLNLDFDANVSEYLLESSTSKKESEFIRNSATNVKAWKNQLSTEEIEKVKEETKGIWTNFYTEDDW